MKSINDIKVTRNCNSEFPDWSIASQHSGVLGQIQFKVPDVCKGYDFIMQCTLRLSAGLLGMPQLVDGNFEHEEIMARMQKITMLWGQGEISEEDYGKYAMEIQKQITALGI